MFPSVSESVARCRTGQATWADVSLSDRLAIVRRLRHALVERAGELCLTVTQDIGRPADEVLATDVLPTADALGFLEQRASRILRPRRVSWSLRPWWLIGESETVYRRPIGIVGVIGTWNYPILLNVVTIAQALTAGNGVVWKPSELVPTFAAFLHQLFIDAGFPRELFARLPAERGFGPQLVEAEIDHLVFTGSADVGRKVAARLGERLIPSTMELSGCDTMYVLDDADVELAARAAWYGATLNVGQTCLAVRRVFVDRKRHDEFVRALRPLAANRRAEPLALMSQAMQAERLVGDAIAGGAVTIDGGVPPLAADDPPRFPPTILVNSTADMAICREASFAPVAAIVPFDDEAKLTPMAEKCPYGLGASIFSADRMRAERLARQIRAGSVSVNDVIVGTAHPATGFGGVRQSGWGVTRGEEGLLQMTVPQVVTFRSGRFRLHFQGDDPAFAETTRGLLQWSRGPTYRRRLAGLWQMVRGFKRIGKK
jgi:acyl-CoA reductase-like NAD-dependent aldehyde dehydrogenase